MRVRYEAFGGIVALDRPAAMLYLDRAYMRRLGYLGSPLWQSEAAPLSAPVTAHLSVTRRCPLNCRICYQGEQKQEAPEPTTRELEQIIDTLAEMRVFTVAFGGGEPLARPDIFALARYARERGLTPTLTTNGYYVDGEMARRCRAFDHVHVSMDGVGETYRAARGADGFAYAVRAIHLLRRNRVPVGVNCVVSRANFERLEELARYLHDCHVRDLLFLRLKPTGRAEAEYEALRLTPEQVRSFYPLFAEISKRYHLNSHVDCAMLPFFYYHRPSRGILRLTSGEGCNGANEIVEIGADGQVHGCSFCSESPGHAQQLPEYWGTAPLFCSFRKWVQQAPEPCRSCAYLDLCHGGCHAIAQAQAGDFNAPDPECPWVERRDR